MKALVAVLFGAALVGCAHPTTVTRIIHGKTIEGAPTYDRSYALVMKGALAEEAGKLDEALLAYASAAAYDDTDPEVLTSIARVRCKRGDRDVEAILTRARTIAPSYPTIGETERACGRAHDGYADALLSNRVDDWRAVLRAGIASENSLRVVTALRTLLPRTHISSEEIATAMEILVKQDHVGTARELAGLWLQGEERLEAGSRANPVVLRLAADHRILRGQELGIEILAHITAGELVARAVLLGCTARARVLAAQITSDSQRDAARALFDKKGTVKETDPLIKALIPQ